MKYDIFISYRRDRGSIAAEKIQHDLERRGFVCFRDKDSIQTGKYGRQIRQAIRQARYFIMVLTDGSVERCCDLSKDDWVREEIKEALRPRWFCAKDVVVPVVPEGEKQDFPSDNELEAQGLKLPAEIKEIREYQISRISLSDYFDGCMNQLVENRLGGAPRHGFIGWIRCLWVPALIGLAMVGVLVSMLGSSDKPGEAVAVAKASADFIEPDVRAANGKQRMKEQASSPSQTGMKPSDHEDNVCAAACDQHETSKTEVNAGDDSQGFCNTSLEKALAALPSIRDIISCSLVSRQGVRIKSALDASDRFDYLLKIEIDKERYDKEIVPLLISAFERETVMQGASVRFRNSGDAQEYLDPDVPSKFRSMFEDYVSHKNWRDSVFHELEGMGDERAKMSATQLGAYRGRDPGARKGDSKRENMKAVVLTERTGSSLTYNKGQLFELPPAVLDRIDAWKKCQESKLELDVVLLDKSGNELADSALAIRADWLDYANYMSYWGKERRAFLVAPFVGGGSLAYYQWVRFNMSVKDANRVTSLKVE